MKAEIKGGLIGFIAVFIVLWIVLFITGHEEGVWKCSSVNDVFPCDFKDFIFSPLHWAFVFFFSWIGFIGGYIDTKIIRKTFTQNKSGFQISLKLTSTIVLSLVFVFAAVGILAFENWVTILIYTIIFAFFVLIVGKIIEKWKRH